jgi:hypothetical protein
LAKKRSIDPQFSVSSVSDKKRKCAVCGEAAFGTEKIAASWVCPRCVTMLRNRARHGGADPETREAFRNDEGRKPTRHRTHG